MKFHMAASKPDVFRTKLNYICYRSQVIATSGLVGAILYFVCNGIHMYSQLNQYYFHAYKYLHIYCSLTVTHSDNNVDGSIDCFRFVGRHLESLLIFHHLECFGMLLVGLVSDRQNC